MTRPCVRHLSWTGCHDGRPVQHAPMPRGADPAFANPGQAMRRRRSCYGRIAAFARPVRRCGSDVAHAQRPPHRRPPRPGTIVPGNTRRVTAHFGDHPGARMACKPASGGAWTGQRVVPFRGQAGNRKNQTCASCRRVRLTHAPPLYGVEPVDAGKVPAPRVWRFFWPVVPRCRGHRPNAPNILTPPETLSPGGPKAARRHGRLRGTHEGKTKVPRIDQSRSVRR